MSNDNASIRVFKSIVAILSATFKSGGMWPFDIQAERDKNVRRSHIQHTSVLECHVNCLHLEIIGENMTSFCSNSQNCRGMHRRYGDPYASKGGGVNNRLLYR